MFSSTNTSSGFGGFGASNNTGSAFGSSNTNTSAFGSTNNNSGGGLFGSSVGSSTSAFGAPSSSPSNSVFGSKPSGGMFGSQTTSTTSPFGSSFGTSNAPTTSGGGLFGAKPAAAFGASTNTGFGSASTTSPFGTSTNAGFGGLNTQQNQGTAIKPFEPFTEKDATSGTNIYESITAMPEYKNFSFEELRAQDYDQGRRFGSGQPATSAGGAFGPQSSPFGASSNHAFGSTGGSTFGASNTGASGGLFGSSNTNTTTPSFGSGTTNNAFGSNNAGGGLFGSSNNNNNNNTSAFGSTTTSGGFGSAFGAKPTSAGFGTTTGSGLFGSNSQPQSTSPFGSNNSNTGTGMFGSTNTGGAFGSTNNTGGGLFGSNTNQPTGGFSAQQSSPFGSNNQQKAGFGGFGSNTSTGFGNTNPAASTGLFGSNNTNNATGGGMFGNPSTPASSSTSGGLFGAKPAAATGSGGLFGNTQQNSTSGGLFANANINSSTSGNGLLGAKPATSGFGQTSANTSGGLFGANNQQQSTGFGSANTTGGLFGAKPATGSLGGSGGGLFANNNQQQPSTGGSMFGSNTPTASGLFGNTNSSNTGTTGGGLFGSKPAAPPSGGLFGSNNATASTGANGGLFGSTAGASTGTTGGLFGNSNNQLKSSLGAGSLFGNNNNAQTQPNGGLFGSNTTAMPSAGGLFGSNNLLNPQQQPQMSGQGQSYQFVATIDSNPYGNNPLFNTGNNNNVVTTQTRVEPIAKPVKTETKPQNITSAYRLAPKPLFVAKDISRQSSPSNSTNITNRHVSLKLTEGDSKLKLLNSLTDDAILASEIFTPRTNYKSLTIERKNQPNGLLLTNEASSPKHDTPSKILNFSEERDNLDPSKNKPYSPTTNIESATKELVSNKAKLSTRLEDDVYVDEDGYWTSPSLENLEKMSLLELRKVSGLVVGRKGYGKIEFLQDVDLTSIGSINLIPGGLIVFMDQSCIVYPDDSIMKPTKIGEGLNLPARITIEGCYPIAKDTNLPIKDVSHGLYKRHLKRLQNIEGTKFVSYDAKTGDWTFTVEKTV